MVTGATSGNDNGRRMQANDPGISIEAMSAAAYEAATYRALGWKPVGTIPDYALRTDGIPVAATFFYKDLRGG